MSAIHQALHMPPAEPPLFDATTPVTRSGRAAIKGQKPCALWLTGLSGAGKSTIARQLEALLHEQGRHTFVLDGDDLRQGLCRDLGFSPEARAENVRRVSETARLMVDAGLIVIVALISPFRSDRRAARALFEPGEFVEVHVDASLQVAEARDPKGLYRRARQGLLPHFTGIGSPYEVPEHPDVVVDTTATTAAGAAAQITRHLRQQGLLDRL